jgi:hypothetical protein
MASWTDNPQLLANFVPYIQQLPISEMVAVGSAKQARYDEGIQKIQTSIDRVAGLDIMRDVDKQYLQSKLTELGGNLKMVAAGDFSNYQLVNSVSGLVGKIGKDNNVVNAVRSTQRVRNSQEEMETARKAGKSSAQNEDYLNTQINAYLNDGDIKTTFNGSYVPYTDLAEYYSKIAKDVEAVENTYDQPFITDGKGNPRYFKEDKEGNLVETPQEQGGHVVVDQAMKTITKKGKAAQTILNNFYSGTSENIKRQLMIDGLYHYKNAGADTFKNDIVNTFALQKKQLTEYSTELSSQLINPKIPEKDRAAIKAELNDITNTLNSGKLEAQRDSQLEELKNPTNLDAYKVKVYTQKYLTDLAQNKSTESFIESLKSNPYFQADMDVKGLQLRINIENQRIKEKNRDFTQGVEEFEWRKQMDVAKLAAKGGGGSGSAPIVGPDAMPTEGERPTSITIQKMSEDIDRKRVEEDTKFLKTTRGYTKSDLDRWTDTYRENPGNVDLKDNDLRLYLDTRIKDENEKARNETLLNAVSKATINTDAEMDRILANEKGFVDVNGDEYSAKKLFEVFNRMQKSRSGVGNVLDVVGLSGAEANYDYEKGLKYYKNTPYEPIIQAFMQKEKEGRFSLSSSQRALVQRVEEVYNKYKPVLKTLEEQRLKEESDYLAPKIAQFVSTSGTLNKENKEDMRRVTSAIGDAANTKTGMVDVDSKKEFDISKINSWMADAKISKVVNYRVSKNFDGSGVLTIEYNKDIQKIPLSADRFAEYFPEYAKLSWMNKVKFDLKRSPYSTTNINKREDATHSGFTGYDLPDLRETTWASKVRVDIEGGYKNDGSSADLYQIRVYVLDGSLWKSKVVNQLGHLPEGEVERKFNNIGMEVVDYILKN